MFVEKVLGKTAVSRQDPSSPSRETQLRLSPTARSLSPKSPLVDHMEYLDGLAKCELDPSEGASQPLPQLAACHDDDDVLDIGLDMHGLSEDAQEALSSCHYTAAAALVDRDDTSFLSLYRRVAEKLEVEWPSPPPAQKPLQFAGFFLPPEPITIKNSLPLFPDFVAELTSTWNKPLSTRITVPGYGQYLDLDGAEKAGLVNPLPMEPSLAAYLAPALPSKHCRFSASQLEKIYRA
ncbi:uncharacterized protein LOC121813534 [Scomber scombrus]|uniref:Uncharacterized protein LOC121813534 n=1 Tax=Scomber scombrus TaxID=13677 RepID=A0AAV1NAI5_SCOSC